MQNEKSISHKQFISVLKHYGIYQDEPLYKILCPVHGDLNPSLQINVEKDFWYCYGCGAHGSSLELIKAFEPNLTTLQAMKKLSSFSKGKEGKGVIGVGIDRDSTKTKTYSEGLKISRDYYYNLPHTNWYKVPEEVFHIKRYLLKRGFTTKTLKKFEAKATYNKLYPVVFPMYDNGLFRGYVMRTDDPFVEAERKYMYSKGFKRRITLPGDYRSDTVVLVEGFLDMLAGKQLGIKNIVCLLGWKMSGEQFKKLKKKHVKTFICALDNDEAGRKGYKYLSRITQSENIVVKRIRYPKGIKDFGDLLNHEKEAQNILKQVKKYGGN